MLAYDDEAVAAIPQTCRLCRQDDQERAKELRARWGCDQELTNDEWRKNESEDIASALAFPCFKCGDAPEATCDVCAGTGEWKLLRCPRSIVERWHMDVCHGVIQQRHGVLPFHGGWMDQPALYVVASRFVNAECVRIEADARDRQIRRAEQASKRGR